MITNVVDPNTLNLGPDPGFWPNLNPELGFLPNLDPDKNNFLKNKYHYLYFIELEAHTVSVT